MSYDVGALRAEQFPVTARCAYLDNGTFGPLPRVCVEAASACLREQSAGARLPVPWSEPVERVRSLAARLIGVDAEDVALVKGSAEGMGLVALGLDWRPGDEVVVYEAEFPAGVLPWLALAHLGVRVRFVRDRGRHRFELADVEELLGERTRAVCVGLVNFGSGFRAPVERIAAACRRAGAWLLVDATQAAGVLPIDARALGCHLLVAHGYKYLLSGHGTALCYVHPELGAGLRVPEPGWRTRLADRDDVDADYEPVAYVAGARRFEPSIPNVPAMAGMAASLELLLALDPAAIARHTLGLAAMAVEGLTRRGYRVVSSMREDERSSILSVERDGVDPQRLEAALLAAGVVTAVRERRLRLSLHGYNDESDVERLLAALPSDERSNGRLGRS